MERSCIYLGEISGAMGIPTMRAGRKHRDEEFSLRINIDVLKAGGTQQDAEEEAYELMALIEDVVADDPGTGGVNAAMAETFRSETYLEGEGSCCRLEFSVRVTNRPT